MLEQESASPVFENYSPVTFRCISLQTHLNQMVHGQVCVNIFQYHCTHITKDSWGINKLHELEKCLRESLIK